VSEDIEVDLYPEASRLAVETRGQVVPSRDGAVVLDLVLGLPLDDLDDSAGMTVRWGERMRVALSPDSMREILTAYGSTGPQAIEMLAEAIQHGTRVSSDRLENAVEHLTPLLRQGRLALEDDPSPVNERGFIAARSALQDVALTGGDPDLFRGLDPLATDDPEATWLTPAELDAAHEEAGRYLRSLLSEDT